LRRSSAAFLAVLRPPSASISSASEDGVADVGFDIAGQVADLAVHRVVSFLTEFGAGLTKTTSRAQLQMAGRRCTTLQHSQALGRGSPRTS